MKSESFPFAQRTQWLLSENKLTKKIKEFNLSNTNYFDLTVSNPTKCGFTYPDKIVSSFHNTNNLNYKPESKGSKSAREVIVSYYKSKGVDVDADNIFLTSSTSEAYQYLFRLLSNYQEEILFPKPSYPLFEFLGEINDIKMVYYTLEYDQEWVTDVIELKENISPLTKALVVVNPNNPTGSYLTDQECGLINDVCGENNIAIIADEVFHDFSIDKIKRRRSFADNDSVLTFTMSGLSKVMALPQMKLSWIVVSGPQKQADQAKERLEVIADTYLSVNIPAQNALSAWMESKDVIQKQILERVQRNYTYLKDECAGLHQCAVLDVQGGWSAVIRLSNVEDEEQWCLDLLENHQTNVHPGYFFDFKEGSHIVISLLCDPEVFKSGIKGVVSALS